MADTVKRSRDRLLLLEGSAPTTPPSGKAWLYFFTDGRLYYKDDAGVEYGVWRSGDTLLVPDGAVGTPSLAFSGDTNTGIYRIGTDTLGIATAGAKKMTVGVDGVESNATKGWFRGGAGSAAEPTFSFVGDPNTGFWNSGADAIQAIAGGLIVVTFANASGAASLTFGGLSSNWIQYGTVGVAAPTLTTRSAGTKLVLYNQISGSVIDYAIGIETFNMWFSTGGGYKWYGNTPSLLAMTLDGGAGRLSLPIVDSGGGLSIGGDTLLYRSAADVLRTPDHFQADGELRFGSAGTSFLGDNLFGLGWPFLRFTDDNTYITRAASGVIRLHTTEAVVFTGATDAPADASVATSSFGLYLDTTATRPKIMAKMKDSAGTVFTKVVAGEPIYCEVERAAAQSVNSGGAGTIIAFDTEQSDVYGIHSAGAFTVPAGMGGLWRLTVRLRYATGTTGLREVWHRINSTDTAYSMERNNAASTAPSYNSGSVEMNLVAGDVVRVICLHSNGSAVNVTGSATFTKIGDS